jgi:tRNA-splicing ligase RtcB (3'-phosphate/5'-hydroxy nucleic acid ligase)
MAPNKTERRREREAKKEAKRQERARQRGAVQAAVVAYTSGEADGTDVADRVAPLAPAKGGTRRPKAGALIGAETTARPQGAGSDQPAVEPGTGRAAVVPLVAAGPARWDIPVGVRPGMRVPGRVYADHALLAEIAENAALEQVANVATLPGIVGHALAMPDIHWGYGFPVGGVAATRVSDGVISPGGIGFDICCGVRLLRSDLTLDDLERGSRRERLADALADAIPAGVGKGGGAVVRDLDGLLARGARWAVEAGYGWTRDLDCIESHGTFPGADPDAVSTRARQRGGGQAGSMGGGNHFSEVQVVEAVYDDRLAAAMGLAQGALCVFLHTGSRGLGHQVCQDYLGLMQGAMRRYGIQVPDRQLACAPVRSPEGQRYLGAMGAAANFAWANRQILTHEARKAFGKIFGTLPERLGLDLVYDVGHNLAKIETHVVDGVAQELCVHRKGATRAFPAGHPELPTRYRALNCPQPVLIPGDMGRYSYVAVGTEVAMQETFGSICHGAGRLLSRGEAKRQLAKVDVGALLAGRGITVRAADPRSLAEEASEAYKDVADVVETAERAGLARKVARLRPLIVVKG